MTSLTAPSNNAPLQLGAADIIEVSLGNMNVSMVKFTVPSSLKIHIMRTAILRDVKSQGSHAMRSDGANSFALNLQQIASILLDQGCVKLLYIGVFHM